MYVSCYSEELGKTIEKARTPHSHVGQQSKAAETAWIATLLNVTASAAKSNTDCGQLTLSCPSHLRGCILVILILA